MRIAIIGLGGMGKLYWDNFLRMKDCSVTAIVSAAASEEEIVKRGARLYRKIDDMLIKEKLDVACVCTPTYLHREQTEALIFHNIHVIAEKPLALHKKDALELFALAKIKGVQLYVAQVVRFAFVSRILKEILKDGRYGRPLEASFARFTGYPQWNKNDWWSDVNKSGHVPFDLHIHDLDLIVSLFGKPKEYSFTGYGNKDRPYKEYCSFHYQYEDFDVTAEAACYNVQFPFTVKWRVFFEKAVVVSDGTKVTAYTSDHKTYGFSQAAASVMDTGIHVPATRMYLDELNHFIDCARHNSPSDVVNNSDVITVIDMLEQMMFTEALS